MTNEFRPVATLVILAVAACDGQAGDRRSDNYGSPGSPGATSLSSPCTGLPARRSNLDALAGGIWYGSLADCNGAYGPGVPVLALANDDGSFRMYVGGVGEFGAAGQIAGRLETDGEKFLLTNMTWFPRPCGDVPPEIISGTIAERDTIEGTWGWEWCMSGRFRLNYSSAEHNIPSSLDNLAGTWTSYQRDAGTPGVWTIDTDGTFVGQDAAGCLVAGYFGLIDDRYNVYEVRFAVSNCALAGAYDGLARIGLGDDSLTWTITILSDDGLERSLVIDLIQ